MVRGIEGNEMSTKRAASQTSSTPGSKTQKTLFGFFQKQPQQSQQSLQSQQLNKKPLTGEESRTKADAASDKQVRTESRSNSATAKFDASLTPAPSSDPVASPSPSRAASIASERSNGLPSPISPSESVVADAHGKGTATDVPATSSPIRKAKKTVNYAESDSEEGDDDFEPLLRERTSRHGSKRRKVVLDDDSGDEFGLSELDRAISEDEEMDDFVVPDDSDEEQRPKSKKRKRPSPKQNTTHSSSAPLITASSPPSLPRIPTEDMEIPEVSTARQWVYDPEHPERIKPVSSLQTPSSNHQTSKKKQKACATEPEQRYTWLADLRDADRNPPNHPDYDSRTVYIPPMAWNNFSPFEKQYWEIKQKFWDTIVFFKKGKFYELYEHDATIGHQLFDLKLTDRVNMRMVGVPEASLDHWASRFVGEGYKIARVDQMENALAKEMRERDERTLSAKEKKQREKEEKVIRRELTSVLTRGTLVDGGMLQEDMSTYCAAIKESSNGSLPGFGLAFVDTATGKFSLSEFVDDADLTRFETFVAQIRPAELLIEKGCLSARAMRILKSNTSPTTIWNFLKPTKEFWPAHITCLELDAARYFTAAQEGPQSEDGDNSNDTARDNAASTVTTATGWPLVLQQCRDKELVMSAFGALLQYLRTLKIERELVTLGNFEHFDPIRKATSLVLDGQSLINLEIFANSFDGGSEGTLFAMLNRCVTPFGKRLLQQWVCHPLADAKRINARLDAIEALGADIKTQDTFTSSLTRLPDLERLISRIHAGRCKAQDFLKVLDGFEQIEYTMSLLGQFGGSSSISSDDAQGEALLGQLVSSMPDLAGTLQKWKGAFDKEMAAKNNILIPEPGVEADFDESSERVEECEKQLDNLLNRSRKELACSTIKYRDIGKEIFQLEVPVKVKNIPKSWDQMSATAQVKRYYTPELRKLVRQLQEAREINAQMAKEVAGRFYARFDADYNIWLAAIKIVAQLDCLISLARASYSLGSPSCRPVFVEDEHERSVISFEDLRHPTMLTSVQDFIPNTIALGGENPNIDLLTGANAAGKSTVLRMTCVAVILAQLGCHVPCASATLTPVDRIMSRLGANDNILQQQSTFFVELAETKKILSEATPRSLVILDELGRGTSSVDGLSVAEAVLHHVAGTVGCTGFFATHYHSLADEFAQHPEVKAMRMAIEVDNDARRVTFLYRLEEGVAEGSFGMHCASMCGIPSAVVERAEQAAEQWEHSGRVQDAIEKRKGEGVVGLGWLSDLAWMLRDGEAEADADGAAGRAANIHNDDIHDSHGISTRAIDVLRRAIESF